MKSFSPGFICTLLLLAVVPVRGQTTAPQADIDANAWKERQFIAFDPQYKQHYADGMARVRALGTQIVAREVAGQNVELSHQIVNEAVWLLTSTADFKRLNQRLDDLQASLDHPEREADAEQQDPQDGTWGKGYMEWFFRLIGTYDHFQTPSKQGEKPQFEYHFIDRINSPAKLTAYFNALAVSDIAHTGVDHERELNESLSTLMRMIIRGHPSEYVYDPGLKPALMDLILHRLRNPQTGFWGERYIGDDQERFVDDLSITFHVVSYLDGDVPDWDKIINTTLAIKDMDFPAGWNYKGQRTDHLDMDVVELFRLGWPHASDVQKKAIAVEMDKLVRWCVSESLQADGSFKFVMDLSKEEGTYYGASFLARAGYFDRSKRFWTNEEFPQAEEVHQRIISYIQKHIKSAPTGGDYYQSALEELDYQPHTSGENK